MTTRTLKKATEKVGSETKEAICVHHWLIEPADSPASKGVCQKCGEERQFTNYFYYSAWETETPSYRGPKVEQYYD